MREKFTPTHSSQNPIEDTILVQQLGKEESMQYQDDPIGDLISKIQKSAKQSSEKKETLRTPSQKETKKKKTVSKKTEVSWWKQAQNFTRNTIGGLLIASNISNGQVVNTAPNKLITNHISSVSSGLIRRPKNEEQTTNAEKKDYTKKITQYMPELTVSATAVSPGATNQELKNITSVFGKLAKKRGNSHPIGLILGPLVFQAESRFDENAKSPSGAKGLGQITSSVPKDLRIRPEFFSETILAMGKPENLHLFPNIAQKYINAIFEADDPKKQLQKIQSLGKLLTHTHVGRNLLYNPQLNSYISAIYLHTLTDTAPQKATNNIINILERRKKSLNYSALNTRIKDVLAIFPGVEIPAITQQTYEEWIQTLKDSPEIAQRIYGLYKYNGSNRKAGFSRIGGSEQNAYTIVIGYTVSQIHKYYSPEVLKKITEQTVLSMNG